MVCHLVCALDVTACGICTADKILITIYFFLKKLNTRLFQVYHQYSSHKMPLKPVYEQNNDHHLSLDIGLTE